MKLKVFCIGMILTAHLKGLSSLSTWHIQALIRSSLHCHLLALCGRGKDVSRNCGISEQGTSDLEDVLSERLEQLPLPASRLTSIDAAQPNTAASLPYPANEDQVRLNHWMPLCVASPSSIRPVLHSSRDLPH